MAQEKKRRQIPILSRLGPGLITGVSDDDPSGIATYSQVGAQFGFQTLWVMLFSYPLMCGIQEISARMGRVTGHGIAGNIRRYYSAWILYPLISLLVVTNIVNLGADIGAMGAALRLLIGGPALLHCFVLSIASLVLQIFIPYTRYVRILKWLTLVLFAYVATVFAVHVPWASALRATFIPSISFTPDFLKAFIAVLGTTISPYLFFWQASEEVEDVECDPDSHPLKHSPEQAPEQFSRIRFDTYFGMGVSNLIAFFIILTAAVSLHAHGKIDIQTASDAAEALRPIAGNLCFLFFACGIVGTGLLAIPVLAGSAAYAVAEARGWRYGLERRPSEARRFYGVIALSVLIGLALNFTHLDPIKALYWTAILNGVISVPIMAVVMHAASSSRIMGPFPLKRNLKILGWLATAVMAAASVGLFVTL